ncbi:HNH endonuclease [Neorhizobium sp. JUb45]|uniref:HNH endonuclease n=1 Tax=Neorhizobium sp. JUb45 TaxID=2485113 RepID=UPI0010E34924|nr:HNH endonuclease [Neorhizobium sp. JUb45]TCR07238.1 AP2 domain-containing protein [Neorhizobium sp. JUb45]
MKDAHSLQYLKECLRYNPETGALHWREDRPKHHFDLSRTRNRWIGRFGGKQITCVAESGYIVFNLRGVVYLAHRVIFAMENNIEMAELPEQIDHKDTVRTNNRRSNLRAADVVKNAHNMSVRRDSASGYKGVTWGKQRQKWRATIQIDGKQKHLGFYEDPAEAHAAYIKAANENFGQFARAA